MRGRNSQHISRGIPVAAKRGIPVLADRSVGEQTSKHISGAIGVTAGRDIVVTKRSVLNNVFYISSRRKGGPSWVIRCIETGDIFRSQLNAANEMNLPASEISRHLNGIIENVRGYHFERICMAA